MLARRSSSRRRAALWIKVTLAVIGAAVLLLLAVYGLGVAASNRWRIYVASLHAKGQPVTFAEIEERRAVVPPERNSATVLLDLAPEFSGLEADAGKLVLVLGGRDSEADFFQGIPAYRIPASREFLDVRREALQKLAVLGDMPQGRLDIPYNRVNPIATLLPEVGYLRSVSRLLHLSSAVALIDGAPARAVDCTRLQLRVAGSLHEAPMLIGRLVQMAIEAFAARGLEQILRVAELSDEQLSLLYTDLTASQENGSIRWGMLGERAIFVDTCESMASGTLSPTAAAGGVGVPGVVQTIMSLPRLPVVLVRANQQKGAEMYTWLIDAGNEPRALLSAAKRLDAEVPVLPRTQVFTKIIMPSVTHAVELEVRQMATLACARCALAAERFRLREGHFPESLAEVVPDYSDTVPTDPFDGQPLRFKTTDDGIVIYSIGHNGADDGGDVTWDRSVPGPRTRPADVGFRLHRPDRRGLIILDVPPPDDD